MGSPDFALPCLRELAANYAVVGVVTQPDRPAGRGRQLTPPSIKLLAQELSLPVIQPRRLKEPEAIQQLHTWAPAVIVVVAFGQILRQEVLDLPPYGCINVHASLLPRWRGAAPIQAAILHGDRETGVTIICMDPGIDTGPVIGMRAISIQPDDTGGSLSERLAELGGKLLMETLPGYLNDQVKPQPQSEEGATYAPLLKKEDGLLDFNQPAESLARRVRAFNPWPGTYTIWENQRLNIHQAHATTSQSTQPGETVVHDSLPAIACTDGLLVLDEVQPAGKRSLPGQVFLRGARNWGH